MFRAVCVHERVCPSKNHIHEPAIVFDEIKAEQFAVLHGERFVGELLAQSRFIAMEANLWRDWAARQFPLRQKNSTGTRVENRITIYQISEPFFQHAGR